MTRIVCSFVRYLSCVSLAAGCADSQIEENTGPGNFETSLGTETGPANTGGTTTGGDSMDSADLSSSDDGPEPGTIPFHVSNIPAAFATPFVGVGDILLNRESCGERAEIDTDSGLIYCFALDPIETNLGHFSALQVQQEGGTEVTLLVGNNVHVGLEFDVTILGSRPLVLAAVSDMKINGTIRAQDPESKMVGHAGGASEPMTAPSKGQGIGGGDALSDQVGSGGGAYCGVGGKGGDRADPPMIGALGGATYGQAAIVPLAGGSSGGRAGNHSGGGGGAIQFIAGSSFELGERGRINVGGLGGGWQGNGGGSGGAVLIESASILIEGVIGANGGGGGGGGAIGTMDGDNGGLDGTAAGGIVSLKNYGIGGAGSFGDQASGSPGSNAAAQGGGGGGGSGWIRLNSFPDEIKVSGILSPSVGSGCASFGVLIPLR